MKNSIHKFKIKILKFLFQPISVYCLHHVCEQYDEKSMNLCDWISITEFKVKINNLRRDGYKFISLASAHIHLKNDLFRKKKYAVLCFDDGYASLKEVLPWLFENEIPVTLFINAKYLDGISFRNKPNETYLDTEELFSFKDNLLEIGSHGYEHTDASKMNEQEFRFHIEKNIEVIKEHPNYIPFHAYTWGRRTKQTDKILSEYKIIPVYIDGKKNYNDKTIVHRELL